MCTVLFLLDTQPFICIKGCWCLCLWCAQTIPLYALPTLVRQVFYCKQVAPIARKFWTVLKSLNACSMGVEQAPCYISRFKYKLIPREKLKNRYVNASIRQFTSITTCWKRHGTWNIIYLCQHTAAPKEWGVENTKMAGRGGRRNKNCLTIYKRNSAGVDWTCLGKACQCSIVWPKKMNQCSA